MSIKHSDTLEEQVVLKLIDRELKNSPPIFSIINHGAYKMAEILLYGAKNVDIPDDRPKSVPEPEPTKYDPNKKLSPSIGDYDKLNGDVNILKDQIQDLKIQNTILSGELSSRDVIISKLEERINSVPSKAKEIVAELEKKYGTSKVPDGDIVGLIKKENLNKNVVLSDVKSISGSVNFYIPDEGDNITCQSHLGADDKFARNRSEAVAELDELVLRDIEETKNNLFVEVHDSTR